MQSTKWELYEYQRSRSVIDLGPNYLHSIFLNFFSSKTADFNISSAIRWAIQDQWSSGFIFSVYDIKGTPLSHICKTTIIIKLYYHDYSLWKDSMSLFTVCTFDPGLYGTKAWKIEFLLYYFALERSAPGNRTMVSSALYVTPVSGARHRRFQCMHPEQTSSRTLHNSGKKSIRRIGKYQFKKSL